MFLPAAHARFLIQLRADGRSPHTVAQYERHVAGFADWESARGLVDVRAIQPEHVAAYLGSPAATHRQDGRRRSAVTVNALRSSLRGFFEFLERAGVIERSPGRVLRMARAGKAAPKGMRGAEVAKLMAVMAAGISVAARRDHALVAFLLGTGSRLSSALALDAADLDVEHGVATLRELKGGGTLEVFLRPELAALLAAWVGQRRRGPVFVGRDGEALTPRHAQRRFDEWLAQAGIRGRYSPHSLRHTFALGIYERTGDVLVVQAALGHRSIASTLVYARASAERVRAAVVG